MIRRLLCRLGRHPGVTICDLTVRCYLCGRVVDTITADDAFARLSVPCNTLFTD